MSVTLLQKGKVIIPKGTSEYDRERISNMTAIDYIMEWFSARTPTSIGGHTSINPTGLKDRVLVIKAGTGSGKSTTIGPELYAYFVGKGLGAGRSIGITQPRVLTAIDIPNKIARIPNMKFLRFGENLGYQTGLFINKPIKGIIFMTIGVITQQITTMTNDQFMRKYSFIILDECHERSLHLDIAMYKLKHFIMENYKNTLCPFLILTSATFDTHKYAKYFECGPENIIEVMGQTKPIAENFPRSSCSNLITSAVQTIINIHENNPHDFESNYGRDIIVFVPGNKKIRDIIDEIKKYNESLYKSGRTDFLVAIKLTSNTYKNQGNDYKNIYRAYVDINIDISVDAHPVRRVIIATPVAETGVTIDSLKYIVDTGLVMSPEWNPVYNATVISERPVTQNMAMQRKGRVGRGFPGDWYPLYTRDTYDKFMPNTLPDVVKNLPDDIILTILIEQALPNWNRSVLASADTMNSFDMQHVDLLDTIPYDSISNTLRKFYALGVIDHQYKPTVKALCAIKFSHVPIEAICMILAGYDYCANILTLATIGAFLSVKTNELFGKKYERRQIFKSDNPGRDKIKTRLFIGCDFIDYQFIFDEIKQITKDNLDGDAYSAVVNWCGINAINYTALKDIFTMRDGIIATLVNIGLNPYRNVPNTDPGTEVAYSLTQHILQDFDAGIEEVKKIKQCIYDGYKMNIATYSKYIKKYIDDQTGSSLDLYSELITPIGFDDNNTQSMPTKIVYNNMTLRSSGGSPFKFSVGAISILDGFVVVDDDLLCS